MTMSVSYALQDKFLDRFFSGPFASEFYLTGGTALSRFYFHHRVSIDLDLFANNQHLDFNDVNIFVNKIIQGIGLTVIKQVVTNTFLQYICGGNDESTLKVDLVKDIPVHFGEIKVKGNIRIDSVENIGSNKILAIFGRTDAKDFIDLYLIIKRRKFSFDHLYKLAKQKDLGLTEFYLANSINQGQNVNQFPQMSVPFNKKEMLLFYQDLSRKLLLRIKPKE